MHELIGQIKSFLTFNYAERRGIVVLTLLIIMVEVTNAFLPYMIKKESIDISSFEEELALFEIALRQPDTLKSDGGKSFKPKKKQNPDYTYKKAVPSRPPVIVEINTADSAALVSLYGIGAVFADRIIKYRGLLGGFYSTEQLLEVYGMDTIRYDQIKDHIRADTGHVNKIPVNEAGFKTLLRHPYLDYETVKAIVNYRQYTDSIPNMDILRKVIAYDPIFEKIRGYIEF